MVCHETYKNKNNKWLYPDEIEKSSEGNFITKSDKQKVIVGPSESMSKSKKNTIDPEEIIKNYGADAARLFILSDSPPEKDVLWSEEGIIASYKFIQKFWTLHQKIKLTLKEKDQESFSEPLEEFTSKTINRVNLSLEKFS